jgi:hypothetical protein
MEETRLQLDILRGRHFFGGLGVGGSIILKCMLEFGCEECYPAKDRV